MTIEQPERACVVGRLRRHMRHLPRAVHELAPHGADRHADEWLAALVGDGATDHGGAEQRNANVLAEHADRERQRDALTGSAPLAVRAVDVARLLRGDRELAFGQELEIEPSEAVREPRLYDITARGADGHVGDAASCGGVDDGARDEALRALRRHGGARGVAGERYRQDRRGSSEDH